MNPPPLRSLLANNPGPFTHEGTRTYILGHRRVAVIDPGPDLEDHVRAVSSALSGSSQVSLVLTHGHGDHAGSVDTLLEVLPQARVWGAGHDAARELADGDLVETDVGTLQAVPTPGHTRDHLSFLWREEEALFVGDMVLGVGDTTWVAEYPGCVADWLSSLARLEALRPKRVYPAHGPDQDDPAALFQRFRAHRESRIEAVRRARLEAPDVDLESLLEQVYGDAVPQGLRGAALQSLGALVDYVDRHPAGTP